LREHLRNTALIVALDDDALTRVADEAERAFGRRLRLEALRREVLSSAVRLAAVLNMSVEEAHGLLKLAAYLHDVGKAASAYQQRLEAAERRDPEKCPAQLRGHEVLSAWLAWHLTYELSRTRGSADDVAAAVAAGVALHHSARRSIDDVLDDVLSAKFGREDLDKMWEAAGGAAEFWRAGAEWDEVLEYASGRMKWEYLQTLNAALVKLRARLLRQWAVWGELVAYVISLADNLDAALRRGDRRVAYVLEPLLL